MLIFICLIDETTERSEGKTTTTKKPTPQSLEIVKMKTEVGKDGTGISYETIR